MDRVVVVVVVILHRDVTGLHLRIRRTFLKSECAAGGDLEILQWAREHHCPWDKTTCESAAEGGHLEVLRWARQHDCPWDEDTCGCAAEGGYLEVMRWALEHGCPAGGGGISDGRITLNGEQFGE